MSRFEITEEIFKSLINYRQMIKHSKCKNFRATGRFSGTSGHENCSSCPGNYYHGGECNYGGHHVLADEINQLNKNFEGIDKLEKRHNKLKLSINDSKEKFEQEKQNLINDFELVQKRCTDPSCFFYGSCVGIDGQKPVFQENIKKRFQDFHNKISKFIESVKNTNQLQFQEFQEKVKKIEDLKQDNQRLMVELKDSNTTPERKAQIQEILKKNTQQIKNLINELKTHPARGFFDQEAISLINNAKQWLVTGNYPGAGSGLGGSKGRGKTGGGSRPDDPNNPNQNQNQPNSGGETWLTPEIKKICKIVGGGILLLTGLWLIYKFLISKLNSE
ncbi:MAG: hypothetical protein MRERV_24c022 [Mycoplasmataceae bacterium RV_VA103A]|nr:MAG: hypothetical protein MRERV_24c022 [Mycoplasmataceae bacterium RV_VA103A]